MKKFLTLAAALILSVVFTVFAGCSTALEKGKIEGDYKEPTQEELETALRSLEGSTMFGDTEQADWEFGVKLGGNFDANVTMGESELTASGNLSFQEKVSKGEEGLSMLGKGELSLKVKAPAEMTDEAIDLDVSADIYNDSSYVYLNAQVKSDGKTEEVKVKTAFAPLFDGVFGAEAADAGALALTDGEGSASATIGISAEELLAFAAEWKVNIGLDTSDGVKLRLSASEETFTKILNAVLQKIMGVTAGTPFDASDLITLSESTFELYLQADKDGRFAAAAANVSLQCSIGLPAANETAEGTKANVDIGGAFYIETNLSDFSLPEGIADDPSYTQQTPNQPF